MIFYKWKSFFYCVNLSNRQYHIDIENEDLQKQKAPA